MVDVDIKRWDSQFLVTLASHEQLAQACAVLVDRIHEQLLPELLVDVQCQAESAFLTFTFENVASNDLEKALSRIEQAYEPSLDTYLSWEQDAWISAF